jgi:sec-independent protein translocase protein TatA
MIESILSSTHLLVILVAALLVLGPKRLPEAGRGLGSAIRGFKDSLSAAERRRGAARDPTVARARSHARRLDVGGRDPNGSVSRQHPRPATTTCQANHRKDAA